jgi:DNA-binding transcriptional LysR family regulator
MDMLHGVKLSTFDLNHVRALHILLEEAHVARAARRLSITPAAASNALARLRRDFDDPLLVRVGRSFTRTALAEALRIPAAEVMASAERLVHTAVPFDAATYDGTFVMTAADRIAEVLLHPLDRLLAERAPRAAIHVRTFAADTSSTGADEGGLVISPALAPELRSEPLFTEHYACVLRDANPLLRGRLTAKRFAAAEHVLVAPRAATLRGAVDDALAEQGLTRRISRVVTSFALALALVESSDRITTLPSSFASRRSRLGGVVTRPPPVRLGTHRDARGLAPAARWRPEVCVVSRAPPRGRPVCGPHERSMRTRRRRYGVATVTAGAARPPRGARGETPRGRAG